MSKNILKKLRCCEKPRCFSCCVGPRGPKGATGLNGSTPYIGLNGNWHINNKDTGVPARGENGATPIIGLNGNWWIKGVDTSLPSRGERGLKGETGEQGVQGEIGPQGIQGETGPQGQADLVAITETITGDAGTPANVDDDYVDGVHNLTFTIPKGEDAPESNLAVAQLNKTTAQTLTGMGQTINFSINQNFKNCLTTQTSVVVQNGGLYKIEYGFTFNTVESLALTLFIDDLDIQISSIMFDNTTKANHGVILLLLENNNEISVRVKQITGEAILSEGMMNGYLVVTPAD